MTLDPWTLWVIVMVVAILAAVAMSLAWLASRHERSLAYWGLGVLLQVFGLFVLLMRGAVPEVWVILIANMLIFSSYGTMRIAIRQFARQPLKWHQLIYAPAIWAVLCLFPGFIASLDLRIGLFSLISAALLALAILDLERVEGPTGIGRWGMRVTLTFMVGLHLARAVLVWGAETQIGPAIISSTAAAWFGLTGMAGLLLASFMLLLMVRERSELDLRRAAQFDELTGLANRRGFYEQATRACGRGGLLTVVLLDLDHFKKVNDSYGHGSGDRVLRLFGQVLRESALQGGIAGGVIGRVGGEEFASLLHGVDAGAARRAADHFREAFRGASARLHHGEGIPPFTVTVSIGIAIADFMPAASSTVAQARLDALFAQADAALYAAKAAGRDRVELVAMRPQGV